MLARRIAALVCECSAWDGSVVSCAEASSRVARIIDARPAGCLFLSFPLELQLMVLTHVSPDDLMQCRLVCRGFLFAATQDTCWRRHCDSLDSRAGPLLERAPAHGDVWSCMLLYWTRRQQRDATVKQTSLLARVERWTHAVPTVHSQSGDGCEWAE